MDPKLGRTILETLKERDGLLTEVHLVDGQVLRALNITWGYDVADEFAHVTTNISPANEGYEVGFFFINEVVRLVDPEQHRTILDGEQG